MTVLLFAGKMLACSGLLFGYYYAFLRNGRFHNYNRFYLLVATLLSFVLPLLKIPVVADVNDAGVFYPLLKAVPGNYTEPEAGTVAGPAFWQTLFSWENLAWLVYIVGVAVLLFAMLKSLAYILSLTHKYSSEKWQGIQLYNTSEEGTPFSFFSLIFWKKDIEFNTPQGQQIMRHELFHVRHLHTADLLFMELVCVVGWFNPFFHLIAKELKAIHEFLADKHASSEGDRYGYAELLVAHTAVAQNLSVTNNFFNNHLKRRINMLINLSNKRYGYRSRIIALPVVVILAGFISIHATRPLVTTGKVLTVASASVTLVIDPGHGGIDAGAISAEGVKEKELCLDISKKIEELGKEYNVKVVLTRSTDILPGNISTIPGSLKKRVSIAAEAHPDLFISIHINSNSSEKMSGFEIMTPFLEPKRNDVLFGKSFFAGSIIFSSLKNIYTVAPQMRSTYKTIYVLKYAPCPALYISCGYLSNEKDLAFISNPANQESIARSILEGTVKYAASKVATR